MNTQTVSVKNVKCQIFKADAARFVLSAYQTMNSFHYIVNNTWTDTTVAMVANIHKTSFAKC